MMDKPEYYIAGLFDASGKISIVKVKESPNSVYVRVVIRSSKKEPLELIKQKYGGTLKEGKRICSLTLTYNKARRFLEDIKDYLIGKKEEVELVLKLYENRFTRKYEAQRKKEIVKRFLELNGEKPRHIKKGKTSLYKWIEE